MRLMCREPNQKDIKNEFFQNIQSRGESELREREEKRLSVLNSNRPGNV